GDYLEFGVFNGTSMLCMHRALKKLGISSVRMFGFDSFEGLPTITHSGDTVLHWHSGQFKSTLPDTKRNLDQGGVDWKKVFLIKGWYDKTLNNTLIQKHHIANASIIMIDCDLYSSTKTALNFCRPLINKEAIILFDDWDSGENLAEKNVGEKKAFDEFLHDNPHFSAEEFGSYYHTELEGTPESKIFLVKRNRT
ncbi:class I SAM-dependent methyltransferase, partial [Candidatus Roizmanbacteria bacterium]|nr:class I SAM-dependent methyltransferase [Candidatus Roizmanbacteria bacterium]